MLVSEYSPRRTKSSRRSTHSGDVGEHVYPLKQGPEVPRKPLHLGPRAWHGQQIDSGQVSRNHAMMSAHNLAIGAQNHWLQACPVPVTRPVPHRLDHCVDLVTVEVLFPLRRFEPARRELVRQQLPAGLIRRESWRLGRHRKSPLSAARLPQGVATSHLDRVHLTDPLQVLQHFRCRLVALLRLLGQQLQHHVLERVRDR